MAIAYNSHSSMTATDEEDSDPVDETEESGDKHHKDSDEGWIPSEELFLSDELSNKSDGESASKHDDYFPLSHEHAQLGTDRGRLYHKLKPQKWEHKMKPYSCNICGKRRVSETSLNPHKRIHDENYERRRKRSAFKTKVGKRTHEQTHNLCDESFNHNVSLRNHVHRYHAMTPGQKNGNAGGALGNGTEYCGGGGGEGGREDIKHKIYWEKKNVTVTLTQLKERKKCKSKNRSKTDNKSGYWRH